MDNVRLNLLYLGDNVAWHHCGRKIVQLALRINAYWQGVTQSLDSSGKFIAKGDNAGV
jgi:hypothetical protein